MADKARMITWGSKLKLFVYEWQGFDAVHSFAPLARQPYSLFLDSSRTDHPLGRYSYLCWHPFETIESRGGFVTVTNRENQSTYAADIFQVVRERAALWGEGMKTKADLPPFQGGAAGYFGYDLARGLEKLPAKNARNAKQPDACIGLYDKVLAFDHENGKAYLMIHAAEEKAALVQKKYIEDAVKAEPPALPYAGPSPEFSCGRGDKQYGRDVARVIDYIHAGDIFQANLSRRFTAKTPPGFDRYAHYRHLRAINPAPYGCFMNFGDVVLSGSSPERFLEVRGRHVETRPIKGTMPDSAQPSALAASEKDRAENVMIVDLLRNDLSKVCEDHSVAVVKLCDVESYAGLHHMVSTVRGTLRGDRGAMDALRACFPGGSITGAPKIRAMQIIEEMEPQRRGAYCGAAGYFGFDGAMDTAIIIRTLVYEGGQVHLQAGGGITAQSDPAREVEETSVKAAKIFESFAPPDVFAVAVKNSA